MPFCDQCGKENREQARFCGHCGHRLQTILPVEPSEGVMKPVTGKEEQFPAGAGAKAVAEPPERKEGTKQGKEQEMAVDNRMWDSPTARKIANMGYGLLAAGALLAYFGIGFVIYLAGGIVAFIARSRTPDWRLASHFRWQLRTFVFGFIWAIIAATLILTLVGAVIGIPLAVVNSIWVIYRTAKGFLNLQDSREMYPAEV